MVYRISSMYTHDWKILRILVTAYVAEFLSLVLIQLVQVIVGSNVNHAGKLFAMYFLWAINRLAPQDVFVQTPVDFCAKEKYVSWIFVIWIPILVFELLICGLALTLGIKYYHALGSREMFPNYRNANRKTPLLYILLRDSILFPFVWVPPFYHNVASPNVLRKYRFSVFCIVNLITFFLAATGLRVRHFLFVQEMDIDISFHFVPI